MTRPIRSITFITVLALLASRTSVAQVAAPAMVGRWVGEATITVNWTRRRVLPIDITICRGDTVYGTWATRRSPAHVSSAAMPATGGATTGKPEFVFGESRRRDHSRGERLATECADRAQFARHDPRGHPHHARLASGDSGAQGHRRDRRAPSGAGRGGSAHRQVPTSDRTRGRGPDSEVTYAFQPIRWSHAVCAAIDRIATSCVARTAPEPSVGSLVVHNGSLLDVNVYSVTSPAAPAIELGTVARSSSVTFVLHQRDLRPGSVLVVMLHAVGAWGSWTSEAVSLGDGVIAMLEVSTDPFGIVQEQPARGHCRRVLVANGRCEDPPARGR